MDTHVLGKTGLRLSVLGYGGGAVAGGYGDAEQKVINAAVQRAIDLGINFFDTAPYYASPEAKSEAILGIALSQLTVPRGRFIVNTKVGRYGKATFDFSAKRVKESVRESLQLLKLAYLDMITVHDIEFSDNLDVIVNDTIPALRELQKEGLVKFVGVSGYPLNVLLHVAQRSPLDFVLSYCHLTLQSTLLADYTAAFEAAGCALVNAAPLSMRFFTKLGPMAWHPSPDEMKALVPRLNDLCEKKGQELSTVAVQFSLNHPIAKAGRVATTLTGMASPQEVDAAVACITRPYDQALADSLREVMKAYHTYSWPSGDPKWVSLPGPQGKH